MGLVWFVLVFQANSILILECWKLVDAVNCSDHQLGSVVVIVLGVFFWLSDILEDLNFNRHSLGEILMFHPYIHRS